MHAPKGFISLVPKLELSSLQTSLRAIRPWQNVLNRDVGVAPTKRWVTHFKTLSRSEEAHV